MTTNNHPAAGALLIPVEHVDCIEAQMYKIEELSLTMEGVIKSDIDPMLMGCALEAMRKELHRAYLTCLSALEKAGALSIDRQREQ
ncbi:hypothetical protein [Noviherbaspirillum aridicola]|uniref:Uncharacterized protein n=1 Tax=Noviherbaspirillum aridicola TaxID=2849687 RepID=A0ABQ4QB71_9BURK|nr:hypothetical protein [Noviherbaspirillum aridicola]GIZ54065.1 hypothetical protein NCCP691_40790 [Noviherbaspirillum aridicola]